MSVALLTILASKPVVRWHSYATGRMLKVYTRFFCDPVTCPFTVHQHWGEVSLGRPSPDEAPLVGEWMYLWPELPVEDDELGSADDAYAVAVGK